MSDGGRSTTALRAVQLLFGAGCVEIAFALIFQLGPADTVQNGTSVRILGAALLSLAVGAFSTVREPRQHRVILRVEVVFTALSAVFLIYRLVTEDKPTDAAWLVLPPVVVCLILLLALYPRLDADPPPAQD
jgi:peptidoglycan/LPS O-acetylase OafA/YrhL